jgi:2-methylcitrate dehydratase PrpD
MSVNHPTTVTAQLATRALDLRSDDIPADVMQIASHAFLDWYSLALASRDNPSVTALRTWVREGGGAPQASLIGTRERCRLGDAALVNGTASHILDFDDAHLPSRVHPSVPLWPAVLALCESRECSGTDVLTAFVAGVEVQSRLARAMGNSHYRVGWHNTATLGSFGATAAVARLLGLSVDQCVDAFGLAATQAGGLRASFGTPAKPLHAGRAAAHGLFCAQMAALGYTGARDIFDREDGYPFVTAPEVDLAKAVARPEHWEVSDIVFKYHASCYGTQAPIDAALAVSEALDYPDAAGIADVTVTVETQYLSVCNIAAPVNSSEAKFSIRHAVALALARYDTVSETSFSSDACNDARLRTLRDKIDVQGSDEMPRANAEVSIRLTNGRVHSVRVNASVPERDMARQTRRLRHKTARLLKGFVDEADIGEFQDRCLALARTQSIANWHSELQRLINAQD